MELLHIYYLFIDTVITVVSGYFGYSFQGIQDEVTLILICFGFIAFLALFIYLVVSLTRWILGI